MVKLDLTEESIPFWIKLDFNLIDSPCSSTSNRASSKFLTCGIRAHGPLGLQFDMWSNGTSGSFPLEDGLGSAVLRAKELSTH